MEWQPIADVMRSDVSCAATGENAGSFPVGLSLRAWFGEMKTILVIIVLAAGQCLVQADQLQLKPAFNNEWIYPVNKSKVRVDMETGINSLDPQISGLTISFIDTAPNSSELIQVLNKVIKDMERTGASPSKVRLIYAPASEPDTSEKLALSAYYSPEWARAC